MKRFAYAALVGSPYWAPFSFLALFAISGNAGIVAPSGGSTAATTVVNPALSAYTGSVGITGNQGNGSDTVQNVRVNNNYPVTAYGTLPLAAEPVAVNATTDGVTAVVTLASAGQFVNGTKIVIYGAGAACSLSPCTSPAAPTGAIVGYVGGGGGSSTSYTYEVAYCGANWDCTPASTTSAAQVAAVTLTEPKETGSDNLGNNITMTGPAFPTGAKHAIWWRSTNGGSTWLLWRSWDTNSFVDWANHQSSLTTTGPFTNTPPASAQGQVFVGKVVSGGGSTTLTLDSIPPTAGTFVAFPDATDAFQSAFNACSTGGGGTVLVPSGFYKIRTVTPKPLCILDGAVQGKNSTEIIGTAQQDVFQWPPGVIAANTNMTFQNLSIVRGRGQIVSMGSAASANNPAFINLSNVELVGSDYAGLLMNDTSIEELYAHRVHFSGGWYGFDMENDGSASNYYIDKSHLQDLQFDSAVVNDIRFSLSVAGNVISHTAFQRVTFNSSDQDPLYVTTPQRIVMWDNVSTEGTVVDSPKTWLNKTVTCQNASNVYLVGSTTGLALGDDIMVPTCGTNSAPAHGTVCAISANTSFTLDDPSCTTAINATNGNTPVTSDGWGDQFLFSGALNDATINMSDLSATSGSEGGGIRYEVNNFNGQLNVNNSIIPVINDQGANINCLGCNNTTVYRPVITSVGFTSGTLSAAPGAGGANNFPLTVSSSGGDINTALLDTVGNGTGSYGKWNLRTADGSRTVRFSLDNNGNEVLRGSITGNCSGVGIAGGGALATGSNCFAGRITGLAATSNVLTPGFTCGNDVTCTFQDDTTAGGVKVTAQSQTTETFSATASDTADYVCGCR